MNSQWLEGTVRHRRKYPVQHEFSYSTGMLALDTDEWNQVSDISPLFSRSEEHTSELQSHV